MTHIRGQALDRIYRDKVRPFLSQVGEWSRLHVTQGTMCARLGVNTASWTKLKERYPEINKALDDGRREMVSIAENKLISLIEGAEQVEETWETIWNQEKKKFVEVRTSRKVKKRPPELRAISYYLNNRASDDWANRTETTINKNSDTLDEQLANMTDAELEKIQLSYFEDEEGGE